MPGEAMKTSQTEIDNGVVVKAFEKSVVYSKLHTEDIHYKKSEQNGKTPAKVIAKEEASVQKKVHFATGKYVCSKKCETLHVNLEHLSNLPSRSSPLNSPRNQNSIVSEKVYFFCFTLSDGGIASAKFSMVISFILLYGSIQIFFYDADEGSSKMIAFFAGVYALCYVHCSRKLISGIHKDKLISFDKDLLPNCQIVAKIITLAIIGCILVYCTRVVLLLWKSMHFEEEPHSGSCFKLVRDFGALHAFSLNSFSRHAAH